MQKHLMAMAAAAILLGGSAGRAEAVDRQGFIVGGSLGGGALTCDDCESLAGLGASFHLGWMIGDRLAVIGEAYAVSHPEGDDETLTGTIAALGAQGWVSDRVWLKAGIGGGDLSADSGNVSVRSDSALAFLGGAGVELIQRERFVLDAQGRFGTIGLDEGRVNMWSIHVGVNWY